MLGNFALSASMVSVASSSERVVWVRYATRSGSGTDDTRHLLRTADYLGNFRGFSKRADNLVVIQVADEDQRVPILGEANCLHMNLRNQRAGRIDHPQEAEFGSFRTDGATPWAL